MVNFYPIILIPFLFLYFLFVFLFFKKKKKKARSRRDRGWTAPWKKLSAALRAEGGMQKLGALLTLHAGLLSPQSDAGCEVYEAFPLGA